MCVCVCVCLSRLGPVPLVRLGEINEHDGVAGVATLSDAGADNAGRGVGEGDARVASTGADVRVNNESFLNPKCVV